MLRTLLLLSMSAVALSSRRKLAVVRPVAGKLEISELRDSFDFWNEIPPCEGGLVGTEFEDVDIEIFLVYSRSFDGANAEAEASMAAIVADTSSPWRSCFKNVSLLSAGLTAEEDIYDPRGQQTNPKWVSGPNGFFRWTLNHFLDTDLDAFFMMEIDAVPRRPNWLACFAEEALSENAPAIQGSRYRGDNWDDFLSGMPHGLLVHVNGNAIYNLKHPFLRHLNSRLQAEKGTEHDRTAFDVRLGELYLEANTGEDEVGAEILAAAYKAGVVPYSGDSKLIGNYANTLINASFWGGEYIHHGHYSNVYDELDSSNVTLVVAHWGTRRQYTEFVKSLRSLHPFRKVVIKMYAPYNENVDVSDIRTPTGEHIDVEILDEYDSYSWHAMCDLSAHVETPYFVFATTHHILASPVTILMDGDKPIIPFLQTSSDHCNGDCLGMVEDAMDRYGPDADPGLIGRHFDRFDTLFVTDYVAGDLCDSRDSLFSSFEDEKAAWNQCQIKTWLTADMYLRAVGNVSTVEDIYTPKSREVKGWRSWLSLQFEAEPEHRSCAANYQASSADGGAPFVAAARQLGTGHVVLENGLQDVWEDEGRQLQARSNITKCHRHYDAPEECDADPECMWRPMFQSGKCIPFHEVAVENSTTTISTTTNSTTTSTSTTTNSTTTSSTTTSSTTTSSTTSSTSRTTSTTTTTGTTATVTSTLTTATETTSTMSTTGTTTTGTSTLTTATATETTSTATETTSITSTTGTTTTETTTTETRRSGGGRRRRSGSGGDGGEGNATSFTNSTTATTTTATTTTSTISTSTSATSTTSTTATVTSTLTTATETTSTISTTATRTTTSTVSTTRTTIDPSLPATRTITFTTTATTTMQAATVASVLIPLNPETTAKDTIFDTIAQLEEAMEAVKASSAPVSELEYIDAPEVIIHVQEDSAIETLEPPTESQVEVILTGVKNLRCKGLSDEECDVALTGSATGLKVDQQTERWEKEDNETFGNASSTEEPLSTDPGGGTDVAGARRLLDLVGRRLNMTDVRYFVNFTCFLIVKRSTYLDETVELSDPAFGTAFLEQVVQIQSEKAATNDTGNASATATLFVSAVPTIQPAVSKALTVVTLGVQEEAPIDVEEFQQKVTDAEVILAAIEEVTNVSDVYDFVYGAPTTDLCYDRDCSGNGICIAGTCQCDAGFSRPNCLERIVSPMDNLSGGATAASLSFVMTAILFGFLLIPVCLIARRCRYRRRKDGDGKGVITPDLDIDDSGLPDELRFDSIIQGVHVPRPAPQPLKNPGLQDTLTQADCTVEWSDSEAGAFPDDEDMEANALAEQGIYIMDSGSEHGSSQDSASKADITVEWSDLEAGAFPDDEDLDANALAEQGIYIMDSGSEHGSSQDSAFEVDFGMLAKTGIIIRDGAQEQDVHPEALAAAGDNIWDEASEDVDPEALAAAGDNIWDEASEDADVLAPVDEGVAIAASEPTEDLDVQALAEQGIYLAESGSEHDPEEAVCMDMLAEHSIGLVESEGESEAMHAEELAEQGIFLVDNLEDRGARPQDPNQAVQSEDVTVWL